jgi:hypothetical protein
MEMSQLSLNIRTRFPRVSVFRNAVAIAIILVGVAITTPLIKVEATNDQWDIACSESPSSANNYLFGVAAWAEDAVVAVGSKNISSTHKPLIERWEQPNPFSSPCFHEKSNPSTTGHSELFGVAKVPSGVTDLRPFWTVGYQNGSSRNWDSDIGDWVFAGAQTLIEYSSNGGQSWSIVSSPNVAGAPNVLKSVSALSDDDAWAVGYYEGIDNLAHTLIMHWDGTSWSKVTSPNATGEVGSYLYGVSMVASDDVWAVGFTATPGDFQHQNLIMRYNGSSWSIVTAPQPNLVSNRYFSVTGISSIQAHSVGTYYPGAGYLDTQAATWNGSSWTSDSSVPNPGNGDNVLYGSAAVSSSYVWAVGYEEETAGTGRTLTERRISGTWNVVSSPNVNTNDNKLRAITVVPGTSVCAGGSSWAVGHFTASGAVNTLAMRYYITPACDLSP